MKIKRILLVLIVLLTSLELAGCKRELPSSIEVKTYLSNKFIGGYEFEHINKEIDSKGYDISYYDVRLRSLYDIKFQVICSSKEDMFNISGIRDTFSDELREKYLKETSLKFGIEPIGIYEYRVKIENDLSKYESICNIIRYLVYYESNYIRYEKSFCREHTISNFIYSQIRGKNKYGLINSKIKLIINDEIEIRLWDYAPLSYKDSKERYENYYKILIEKDRTEKKGE